MQAGADLDVDEESEAGAGTALLVGYSRLSDAEKDLASADKAAELRQRIRQDLSEIVSALHAEWLEQRRVPSDARPQRPRVGRNDPCPCGSGKKYKKCHGANA